jgi:hypothetical protein
MKTLTITKEYSQSALPVEHGLRITVTASTDNMTKNIFVWQRNAIKDTEDSEDIFVGVATPVDIEEIPETTPDVANEMPYYRTAVVEVWFRTYTDFEFYSTRIQTRISMLLAAVNGLEEYAAPITVTL